MTKVKYPLLLILNFVFILLAYGIPVEIKGALQPLLWLIVFGVMIYCIKTGKKFLKIIFVLQLIIYIMASGLFCIREYSSRELHSSHYKDNIYSAVYQLNPGAMGHFSVQQRKYFCIVNNKFLSIRILLSQDTKRGSFEI